MPTDVSRGLGNLPQETKPAELARSCHEKGERGSSELYDIGRGGMAVGPEEPLMGSALQWIGLGDVVVKEMEGKTAGNATTSLPDFVTLLEDEGAFWLGVACRRGEKG